MCPLCPLCLLCPLSLLCPLCLLCPLTALLQHPMQLAKKALQPSVLQVSTGQPMGRGETKVTASAPDVSQYIYTPQPQVRLLRVLKVKKTPNPKHAAASGGPACCCPCRPSGPGLGLALRQPSPRRCPGCRPRLSPGCSPRRSPAWGRAGGRGTASPGAARGAAYPPGSLQAPWAAPPPSPLQEVRCWVVYGFRG